MSYWEAVLYGAVQGLTEYLPVSSSAHLILLPAVLGKEDPGLTFDVFLHLGTLLSTLIYFRKDWLEILSTVPGLRQKLSAFRSFRHTLDWKMLVIATIPAVVVGGLLHSWIRSELRDPQVLVFSLSIGGVLLFVFDRYASQKREMASVKDRDAFWVGVAQCFALIPGVSRSGATITGARLLGLNRTTAAKFSFLISAPIMCAAVVFELRHWKDLINDTQALGPVLVAGLSSFVFGMIAIGGLLRLLRQASLFGFAVYRILAAGAVYYFLVL